MKCNVSNKSAEYSARETSLTSLRRETMVTKPKQKKILETKRVGKGKISGEHFNRF